MIAFLPFYCTYFKICENKKRNYKKLFNKLLLYIHQIYVTILLYIHIDTIVVSLYL